MHFKCFLVFLIPITINIYATEQIKITADIIEGTSNDNNTTETLKNNVRIVTDGTIITSKFATHTSKKNKEYFKVYDTVEISKPSEDTIITAGEINFLTGEENIHIVNQVRCERNGIIFTTDACDYNQKTNVVKYSSGGTFIRTSDNMNVYSTKGECDLTISDFTLSDNVNATINAFIIHCDKIEYKKSDNKLIASGNIKIDIKNRKDEFITTPEQIVYDMNTNVVIVNNGLYHSPTHLLAAKNIIYDHQHKQLLLNDNIEIILRNKLRFTCDRATYDTKTQHGDIYGSNVLYDMTSTEKKFLYIYADKFSFDIIKNKDNHDDYLQPDELDNLDLSSYTSEDVDCKTLDIKQTYDYEPCPQYKKARTEESIVIEGNGNVQLCTNSIQGRTDKICFVNDAIMLPHKTIIWNDTNMVIGNNIRIFLSDGNIKKLKILETPLFVNADSLGFYNQVSADSMIANIKDNNITRALFMTNVDTFYFVLNDNKLTGVNRLKCSKFFIFFDKEKLKTIYFNDKIYGNFYFADYAEKNKTQLLLDRLTDEGDFIKNTIKPDINSIKSKINPVKLISEEDKNALFKT